MAVGRNLAALREANFRWFWIGLLSFALGQDMLRFLVPWLAYEVTGSSLALGLMGFSLALPQIVLVPFGGVWADRLDRLALIRASQAISLALTLVLVGVLLAGLFELWHLVLFALLKSAVYGFDNAARGALLPALVKREALLSAAAATSVAWTSARVLGPVVAGALLVTLLPLGLGAGPVFAVVALSFVGMLLATARIRVPSTMRAGPRRLWSHEFMDSLGFIVGRRSVLILLLLVFAVSFFGASHVLLMPAFAKEVYAANPSGLALLLGSVGAGGLVGASVFAMIAPSTGRGTLLLLSAGALGAGLVAFSLSRAFELSVLFLFCVGVAQSLVIASAFTLLQVMIPDSMRGRILSIHALWKPLMPLGAGFGGSLASFVGTPTAVGLGGLALVLVVGAIAARTPEARSLQ